jgi:hypothetical protein
MDRPAEIFPVRFHSGLCVTAPPRRHQTSARSGRVHWRRATNPRDRRYGCNYGEDERLAAVKMLIQPLPSFEIVVLKFGRFHGVTRQPHRKAAFEHEGHGIFDFMRL